MNFYNAHLLCLLYFLIHVPYSTSRKFKPSNWQLQPAFIASCPAPRFDTFTDNILGPWEDYRRQPRESPVPNTNTKRGEVEEVMRSCGGAVQGIKEVPLLLPPKFSNDDGDDNGDERQKRSTNENTDEGPYHNRADDGFLFFDCGSYVSLPQDYFSPAPLSPSSLPIGDGVALKNIVCCLSFQTTIPGGNEQRKVRTITTTRPPSFQTLVRSSSGGASSSSSDSDFNHSTTDRSTANEEQEGDGVGNRENDSNLNGRDMALPLTSAPYSIRWEKGILCQMSSPAQPWMLQRASWEQYTRDDIDGGVGDGASSSTKNEKLRQPSKKGEAIASQSRMEGWATIFNVDRNDGDGEGKSNLLLSSCVGKAGTNHERYAVPEGTCTILQMGSRCCITDEVKAILCFYGKDHELRGVSLQEGRINK